MMSLWSLAYFWNSPSRSASQPKPPEMGRYFYPMDYKTSISFTNEEKFQAPSQAAFISSKFRTHTSIHAERLHSFAEFIIKPADTIARLFFYAITNPYPGENKGGMLRDAGMRLVCFLACIPLSPFALTGLVLGLPLRMIAHAWRPAMSFYYREDKGSQRAEPIHAFPDENLPTITYGTQNLAFVPRPMQIAGDLRDAKVRALELAEHINNTDYAQDTLAFQEGFTREPLKIFLENLKNYPYCVHSVAPTFWGFNSGLIIVSKFPFKEVNFERWNQMVGPERASPRGILSVLQDTDHGPYMLYNMHTQALLGQENAQARLNNFQQLHALHEKDKQRMPELEQPSCGDLNTSRLTAFGEDNMNPPGQAEEPVMKYKQETFREPFFDDHHALNGERTQGVPFYLESQSRALAVQTLREPTATWFYGPVHKRPAWLALKESRARKKHNQPEGDQVITNTATDLLWGRSKKWRENPLANTAIFDGFFFPKTASSSAATEITYPGGNEQSGASDHLPLRARVWKGARYK